MMRLIAAHHMMNDIETRVFSLLPKKQKIAFVNFCGRGFGDNPKYIAEEILRQRLPWDLVWLVGDMSLDFPEGIRKVKYYSMRSKYELATAKVIISNAKGRMPYVKRSSQHYLQTWHGGFPLKYIEKEAEDTLDENYLRDSKYDSSITDLIISGSEFQTNIIRESFWYNGEIFKKGVPRNDALFNNTPETIARKKHQLGFADDERIVIYAPTFRDDYSTSAYAFDTNRLLDALRTKTGRKWKLIVRLHPVVANQSSIFTFGDDVINGSHLSDPQDLLIISDLLITDYSSMMMDFGIMHKPVLLYCTDLQEYVTKCRALRPIFYELPFEKCASSDELCSAVANFDLTAFHARLNDFLATRYNSYDDGHASEHVVERIKQWMV